MGNGVQIYDNRQSGENAKAIWSLKNKRDVRSSVNSLAWSPSGHLLACGCESGLTYLWDVRHHTKQMNVLTSQQGNPVQVKPATNFNFNFYFNFDISLMFSPELREFRFSVGALGSRAFCFLARVFPSLASALKVNSLDNPSSIRIKSK